MQIGIKITEKEHASFQSLHMVIHAKRLYVALYITQSNSTLWFEQPATDVNQKGKSVLLQEGMLCKLIGVGRNQLLIEWWVGHGQLRM